MNIIRERITEHVSGSERVVGLQRERVIGVHAVFLTAGLHAHILDQIDLGHPSTCVVAFVDLVSFAVEGLNGELVRLSSCPWIDRASHCQDVWLLSWNELTGNIGDNLALDGASEALSAGTNASHCRALQHDSRRHCHDQLAADFDGTVWNEVEAVDRVEPARDVIGDLNRSIGSQVAHLCSERLVRATAIDYVVYTLDFEERGDRPRACVLR